MKRKKKKLPAERSAIEVRYAYEGRNEHKSITVSLVKIDPSDEVIDRRIITSLHPNAKKRAFEVARTLSTMSAAGKSELIIDEHLMRDEYACISTDPIVLREL